MKKYLLFSIAVLLFIKGISNPLLIDGIYYNIISSTEPYTVEVTFPPDFEDDTLNYTGYLIIPPTILYNDTTYQVIGIGMDAFVYSPEVKYVYIPEGVTYIADYAFERATEMDSVHLPSTLTSIGRNAFIHCYSLQKITIPENVEFIGKRAFHVCTGLKEVHYNAVDCTVELYWSENGLYFTSLFFRNDSIQILTIGNGVTKIPNYAFSRLKRITTLDIPEGVTVIGIDGFAECIRLKTIYLPSTLTDIYYGGFQNIPRMQRIYIAAETPPSLGQYAFTRIPATIPVYIPCLSIDDYQNSSWGNWFNNFNENQPYNIELTTNYTDRGRAYFLQTTCSSDTAIIEASAFYGYQFSQWEDGATENPRTVVTHQDTAFEAEFTPREFQVTVNVNNANMGYVAGGGFYEYKDEVILYVTTFDGYIFDHWHDDYRYNPRRIILTQDTTLTAYFSAANSIDEIQYENIKIYSANGEIIVKNATSLSIEIYDVLGRCVLSRKHIDSSPMNFPIPQRGVYIVRIGQGLTQKVVVQ